MTNFSERVNKIATRIVLVAFAIIAIGTASIPAVLAALYTWVWLLLYPLCMITFFAYATKHRKR